jgi:uncharacterized protein YjeT (DUF2065 family)
MFSIWTVRCLVRFCICQAYAVAPQPASNAYARADTWQAPFGATIMVWHRTKWADALLRLAGAFVLAIGVTAGLRLFGSPTRSPSASAYVLALIGFVAVTAGTAMLVLGTHLFDEIPLSPRWTRRL